MRSSPGPGRRRARYARWKHHKQPAPGSTASTLAALWTDGMRISEIARELGARHTSSRSVESPNSDHWPGLLAARATSRRLARVLELRAVA
jgi:hypothetical protein